MSIVTITKISGTAVPLRGNDVDTDRIIPARYLKEVTFARMGDYPFFDERFDSTGKPKIHPFNDPKYKGASILLVNKNFGCGSSREHAPQALYRFGVSAIVGESFAAIFAGNCTMIGVPAVTAAQSDVELMMNTVEGDPQTRFLVDIENKTVTFGEQQIPIELPESYRTALTTGSWDSTALLRANLDQVKRIAAKLPYMTNFNA
jgi:3-isopropylmalate/(R)-2-methylmalate dehydratase small subunit